MSYRLTTSARRDIREIWDFTVARWSNERAKEYVRGLANRMSEVDGDRSLLRQEVDDRGRTYFFARYEAHFIIVRPQPNGDLKVLAILHRSMDLPTQIGRR